jgi:hypothetical protein
MDIILFSEALLIEGIVAFSWKEIIAHTRLATSHAKARHTAQKIKYMTQYFLSTRVRKDALRPASLPDGRPGDIHFLILNYLQEYNVPFFPCYYFMFHGCNKLDEICTRPPS